MSVLPQLAGCWKVTRFVDPNDLTTPAFVREPVPEDLSDVLTRNEVLYLKRTEKPQVLYCKYSSTNKSFWVTQNKKSKTSDVVIKAPGELKFGGSYKLVLHESRKLVWKSIRDRRDVTEHAIQWILCNERRHSDARTALTVPTVPVTLLHTSTTKACACGKVDCGGTEPSFVNIRRPKTKAYSDEKLQSKQQKVQRAALWAKSRALAHWQSFRDRNVASRDPVLNQQPRHQQKTLKVCTCHMHPFAQEQFRQHKNEKQKKKYFNTFVIDRAAVDAAVTTEDREAHFLLVEELGGYLPKLNYDGGASTSSPLATATAEIRRLHQIINDLRKRMALRNEEVSELKKRLDADRRANNSGPRERAFFTEKFHCSGNQQYRTLRNFFGMTNNFRLFTATLEGLFFDFGEHGLVEEHSEDDFNADLTAFEQCLMAKWCVFDV